MISVCQPSLLFKFLVNSSLLNNLGVIINNPLELLFVFVLVLLLRDLDNSSLIKFIFISYVNFSILLMFKLLTFLKGFCLLVFAQEGSQSLIFKDAGQFGTVLSNSGDF